MHLQEAHDATVQVAYTARSRVHGSGAPGRLQDIVCALDVGAEKLGVPPPKAKLARRVNDRVAAIHCGLDRIRIARIAPGQLDAPFAQKAAKAGRPDQRANPMPALDENRDEIMAQKTGCASDKNYQVCPSCVLWKMANDGGVLRQRLTL